MKSTTAKSTQTEQTPERVAIYVRLSSASDELGVKRQEKAARALLKMRGWKLAKVYVENNTSASGKVKRPVYDELMRDAKSGVIDCIVVWSLDRLTRSVRETLDVIELYNDHDVPLVTVQGGLDTTNYIGQMVITILAAVARQELDARHARQLEERVQKAELGHVHGGGKRPFGYDDDRMTIIESEAEVIREAARRVLAGESLRSVSLDFTSRGIVGSSGTAFNGARLKQVLIGARISGRREHWQAKKKGDKRPTLAPIVGDAQWKPIISADDSDALRLVLTRDTRPEGATARKHLLPGFLQCSLCKRPMQSMTMHSKTAAGEKRIVPSYGCATKPGEKCRKVVVAARVEEVVVTRLLTLLDDSGMRKRLHDRVGVSRELMSQLARDEQRLVQLSIDDEDGKLTPAEFKARRAVVVKRIDAARRSVEASVQDAALFKLLAGDDIELTWEALTLDQKRAVMTSFIERIVIAPPSKSGRTFDVERVQIEFAA
jgi:site-specific DNA recombinase